MRTTIDKVGRLVIPKALRDQLGLTPGEVEVSADGVALRVEAIAQEGGFVEVNGRWVIPAGPDGVDPTLPALIEAMIEADRNRHGF